MSNAQRHFFDGLARTKYNNERGRSFAIGRITNIVSEFILDGIGEKAKLLEYGCGKGHWTLVFLKLGFEVVAVDFSRKSLEALEEKAKNKGLFDRLKVVEADITGKPIFESGFDRVFCINTLHHLKDPSSVVSNMAKAVKAGGKVSVLEPNPLNLWWWVGAPIFDRYYNLKMEGGILRCFPWKIRNYFKKAGLKNTSLKSLELFPAISPDRFRGIVKIENFLFKIPLVSIFSGLNLVGGWRRQV